MAVGIEGESGPSPMAFGSIMGSEIARPTTVFHCSDLHFGAGFLPERAERLLERIEESGPDAVIVSGDLTMRARPGQFRAARQFLERIRAPLMVIPGNHDVPLFNLLARLRTPFGNYARFVGDLGKNSLILSNVGLFGLNTVNPARHQQGRVTEADLQAAEQWLASAAEKPGWRVIVVHQHFGNLAGHERPGKLRNGREVAARLSRAGAHAVLHGHVHYGRVTWADEFFPDGSHPLALICAGTATSRRCRGAERENTYNVIEFFGDRIVVRQCDWHHGNSHFADCRQTVISAEKFA